MIIRIIASNRSIEIDDAQNFKAFAVRIEGSFADPAAKTALLGRVAARSDREHAWISEQALREWPALASQSWWQDGLSKMIEAVQPYGWIDPVDHSIQAHIEYQP
jgi:predicted transcriptional regulator